MGKITVLLQHALGSLLNFFGRRSRASQQVPVELIKCRILKKKQFEENYRSKKKNKKSRHKHYNLKKKNLLSKIRELRSRVRLKRDLVEGIQKDLGHIERTQKILDMRKPKRIIHNGRVILVRRTNPWMQMTRDLMKEENRGFSNEMKKIRWRTLLFTKECKKHSKYLKKYAGLRKKVGIIKRKILGDTDVKDDPFKNNIDKLMNRGTMLEVFLRKARGLPVLKIDSKVKYNKIRTIFKGKKLRGNIKIKREVAELKKALGVKDRRSRLIHRRRRGRRRRRRRRRGRGRVRRRQRGRKHMRKRKRGCGRERKRGRRLAKLIFKNLRHSRREAKATSRFSISSQKTVISATTSKNIRKGRTGRSRKRRSENNIKILKRRKLQSKNVRRIWKTKSGKKNKILKRHKRQSKKVRRRIQRNNKIRSRPILLDDLLKIMQIRGEKNRRQIPKKDAKSKTFETLESLKGPKSSEQPTEVAFPLHNKSMKYNDQELHRKGITIKKKFKGKTPERVFPPTIAEKSSKTAFKRKKSIMRQVSKKKKYSKKMLQITEEVFRESVENFKATGTKKFNKMEQETTAQRTETKRGRRFDFEKKNSNMKTIQYDSSILSGDEKNENEKNGIRLSIRSRRVLEETKKEDLAWMNALPRSSVTSLLSTTSLQGKTSKHNFLNLLYDQGIQDKSVTKVASQISQTSKPSETSQASNKSVHHIFSSVKATDSSTSVPNKVSKESGHKLQIKALKKKKPVLLVKEKFEDTPSWTGFKRKDKKSKLSALKINASNRENTLKVFKTSPSSKLELAGIEDPQIKTVKSLLSAATKTTAKLSTKDEPSKPGIESAKIKTEIIKLKAHQNQKISDMPKPIGGLRHESSSESDELFGIVVKKVKSKPEYFIPKRRYKVFKKRVSEKSGPAKKGEPATINIAMPTVKGRLNSKVQWGDVKSMSIPARESHFSRDLNSLEFRRSIASGSSIVESAFNMFKKQEARAAKAAKKEQPSAIAQRHRDSVTLLNMRLAEKPHEEKSGNKLGLFTFEDDHRSGAIEFKLSRTLVINLPEDHLEKYSKGENLPDIMEPVEHRTVPDESLIFADFTEAMTEVRKDISGVSVKTSAVGLGSKTPEEYRDQDVTSIRERLRYVRQKEVELIKEAQQEADNIGEEMLLIYDFQKAHGFTWPSTSSHLQSHQIIETNRTLEADQTYPEPSSTYTTDTAEKIPEEKDFEKAEKKSRKKKRKRSKKKKIGSRKSGGDTFKADSEEEKKEKLICSPCGMPCCKSMYYLQINEESPLCCTPTQSKKKYVQELLI